MSSPSEPGGGGPDPGLSVIMGERRALSNLAYRLLGSLTEAEDAVQDTYARWYAMTPQQQRAIGNPGAWLTTVASRICLDMLGSARARRETYVGAWLPERVRGEDGLHELQRDPFGLGEVGGVVPGRHGGDALF